MRPITRQALIEAIEAGIEAAPGLSEADREALRRVGRDVPAVAAGAFYGVHCDCPAAQAGLYAPDVRLDVIAFARAFDRAVGIPAGKFEIELEVVE